MSNIKNKPIGKQYEWLLSKIFHDNFSSINDTILPDTRIIGKYSKRSRQIDILVDTNEKKIVIECKHHKRPLDLKQVEPFFSMYNDLNVDNAIIISSSGFTKSAKKRVEEFEGKIKLEHLNWERAYENSFEYKSYGKITDICEHCYEDFISGTEVPGLLLWEAGYALEKNKIQFLFAFAKCLKCNEITIYCDSCGVNTLVGKDEYCCQEALFFYQFLEDNAMTGKK
jgi:hypothetical protein